MRQNPGIPHTRQNENALFQLSFTVEHQKKAFEAQEFEDFAIFQPFLRLSFLSILTPNVALISSHQVVGILAV